MKRPVDKEWERKRAEAEARQKREQIEKLTPKLVEQKARWEREGNKKLTQSESVGDESLTREEINIKILDKVFTVYEEFDGENFDLYLLLDDMLNNTVTDPYKTVAFELQYNVGDIKELVKEIAVEFDIPSYEEIEAREREEEERERAEEARRKLEWAAERKREREERKRERVEELTPKLVEQKARWKRVRTEKSADDEYVADGSLTREEINIKILDKVFKVYEELGEENSGLDTFLYLMLHGEYRDPYKWVASELSHSGKDTKELMEEIAVEFDIPSYEEIETRERKEVEARRKREREEREREERKRAKAEVRRRRELEERKREQAEEAHREWEEREHEWAEYEARRKREREERERKQAEERKRELVSKLVEQKARWERAQAKKSADSDDLADGSLTREEINIKILDKVFTVYEEFDGENFGLYLLLDNMLNNTVTDPYKKVAYELRYSLGDKKQYLKEIAVEFDIPSYGEIEAREREEEERERREELNRKLDEQKAHWERERNKKLTESESVGDESLTREEINIKILDKIFKAYEKSGGESYGLNSLLDDMLDLTHRDPYEWVAYELRYSSGDTKEHLEEIADEFDIPSYEEIEKRKREEREREWAAEDARREREEIAGGIINAIGAILGFFIGFFLTILFKNPPKNNSQ